MTQFLTVFALALTVSLVSFLLLNVRYIFTGQSFRGSCSQNNPLLKNTVGECTVCGKKGDEVCKGTNS